MSGNEVIHFHEDNVESKMQKLDTDINVCVRKLVENALHEGHKLESVTD